MMKWVWHIVAIVVGSTVGVMLARWAASRRYRRIAEQVCREVDYRRFEEAAKACHADTYAALYPPGSGDVTTINVEKAGA